MSRYRFPGASQRAASIFVAAGAVSATLTLPRRVVARRCAISRTLAQQRDESSSARAHHRMARALCVNASFLPAANTRVGGWSRSELGYVFVVELPALRGDVLPAGQKRGGKLA
jgi:hypothetical protein